jgi:hypothetical protein
MAKIEQVIDIMRQAFVILLNSCCVALLYGLYTSRHIEPTTYLYLNPYNQMKKILLPLLLLVAYSQCKKSGDDPVIIDYLPLTVGTNWTYISNGVTSKLTVTSKDTVALGRTYKVVSNNNGANQYHGKSGNEYFRFATFQGFLPNGVEELYLKSDHNVNGTWQFTVNVMISGFPVPVTAKYTITEKGIAKTVQGKNYTDVVKVVLALSSPLGNAGGGDFYYAKGIGMISSSLNIMVPGSTTSTTTELTAYEIK